MNAARQKGTTWETAIVEYLRPTWPHVERRARNGAKDRGDISGLPGLVVEAKNARSWRLPEWWKETETETANAQAAYGALWIKRQGKTSAANGWVVMDGATFARLLKDAGW